MATTAASVWDQRNRRLSGAVDDGFAHQVNLPEAQLTFIGWKPGIHIESGTPPDSIGFVQQLKGTGRMRVNGRMVPDGELVMMHSPHDYDLVNTEDTHYLVLTVDKNRVRRHMEAFCGRPIEDFESISHLTTESPAHNRLLERTFKRYLHQVYQAPDSIFSPNAQDRLIEELLDSIFLSGQPSSSGSTEARRHVLAHQAVG